MTSRNTHSDPAETHRWFEEVPSGLVAGFILLVVGLILMLALGLANLAKVSESTSDTAHTYAVKAQLQRVLTTAVDAETGERGFIITGTPGYLEPYESARAEMTRELARLRTLVADNPDQVADLNRLATATETKFAELVEAIRQRRDSGPAAAEAVVRTNVGKRTMDEMRVIVAGMEAREDALLAVRIDVASQSYNWARLTLLVTSGLAVVLVLALFLSARRVGKERWRAQYTAERLEVTLKSIGDAVMTTDGDGRVHRLNPVAQTLTGWTEADAAGKRVEDVFVIINEHTREPVDNPIRQVLRDGLVVALANHTVLIAKDGREVPVEDSASPIKTAEGMIGVVMVFRDVTERRAVERERAALIESEQRARARSDQENRMKDDFLAMLSHELRTPLGVILGWSDMLRQGLVDEPRRERALIAIHENAALQMQMVDALLDTARISAGKLQLARASVDVRALARNVVESMQPRAEAKGVQLVLHIDPALSPMSGDPDRLAQVLLNLLTNAIKFTPQGGVIRVGIRLALTTVEIEVADTGIGIAPAFLPFVFEPFRQADTSQAREHHGLGLGLSIVKRLVEAHGGTVSAESPGVGHGATFLVRLPVIAVDAEQAARPHHQRPHEQRTTD